MGALLKFQLPADVPVEASSRHRRLRARARVLSVVFTGVFWLCAACTAAMVLIALFYQGRHMAFGPGGGIITSDDPDKISLPSGYLWWADVTLRYRLGGGFAVIMQFTPAIMVMANLRGLFRLYAAGIVFAEKNARYFKRMGAWLIAYAVTPFLSVKFLTLIHCVLDEAWFHNAELYALGLGSILFVIAEVMEAGREIEQERDEFV